ncbi:HlyD family efflux transporter periplasmic adaptor subunit [Simkania sp.]|uniref:HlyD family efflux transporter periplasmic adaptor subunit n=1 Tax=Simkania sp. TaxID=34094 RepID=UPI003B52C62E
MAKEIFRHDSVERLSSPSQLNKLLVVIRLRGWVVLATLVAIILGILVWSFLGEIPIITTGRGILLAPDAQYTLNSPTDGVISQVYIKTGSQVQKGQVLMELSDGKAVLAPNNGIIFQMEAGKGQQVKQGDVLMWFERKVYPKDLVVYAFIPIEAGERVKKGMKATVDLGAVDTQKYGQLLGQVTEVVPYAVSKDSDRLRVIPSEKLREDLTKGATAMLVIIQPFLSPDNKSGLTWTYGKGPPDRLAPGSLGTVRITIENKKPISYLIPILS